MNTVINKEKFEMIKTYIDNNILIEYKDDNSGHGIDHIKAVIKRSLFLIDEFDLNVTKYLAYIIAGYHDIGHKINKENHEKISAQMFLKDQYLTNLLNQEEIKLVKEAIEDHRSKKKITPRSIYGKILCDADRQIDIDDIIKRVFKYTKKHYNPKNLDDQVDLTYKFIKNKNQDKDRMKFYFNHKSDIDANNKLLEMLNNEIDFKRRIKAVNNIK